MRYVTKVVAILLGAILGLDASVLLAQGSLMAPENVITVLAVLVIILEFWDNNQVARQVCRFSVALIGGIAVRQYSQMSMQTCFVISVITIIAMVLFFFLRGVNKDLFKRNSRTE